MIRYINNLYIYWYQQDVSSQYSIVKEHLYHGLKCQRIDTPCFNGSLPDHEYIIPHQPGMSTFIFKGSMGEDGFIGGRVTSPTFCKVKFHK